MTNKSRQTESKDSEKDQVQEIPGMDLDTKYSAKKPILPEGTEKLQKEMEKAKKEFDRIKAVVVKKYPFVQAIGIIAPQAAKLFIEDELGEGIPAEELGKLQKKTHLYIVIPEDKFKEIPKIKKELISEIDKLKKDVWLYLKTPVDIWEACLDSKFELVSAIGMSYPLHDKGILEALRVAEIHKALVLQKFDKYVVSYVIAGSIVRGDTIKESDVDSFIIINDTDVKRMPRLELKE
ncbi:MAG: nucleotidyltransferase domain-containing protein, partial [Nanoarchaeota archaeon]